AIPYALELLALPYFSVVPAEDVERWWKDYRTHPIGAGPYRLEELKPGQAISLQRFTQFYDSRLPRTESVQFSLMPGPKEEFLAFTRRELDHAPLPKNYFHEVLADPVWNPLGETRLIQAERVANLEETRVVKTPSWTTDYISMDNHEAPFNDPKVRQAFNYAVDKRMIIEHLLDSYGQPVTGVFPPAFPGANRRQPAYAHNPDTARKLLFETGWRDRDGDGDIEPWQDPNQQLTLYYRDPEDSLRICQQIQADLAEVGVTVTLAPLKSFQDSHRGQVPAFFHTSSTPEILDPSQLFHPTFHSSALRTNLSRYANPRVNELVGHAEDLNYEPRRYELYQEAERLIMEDAPWLFLYHPVNYRVVQPRVRQYAVHPVLPFAYETFDVGVQTAER
ncbi:MAG: ABC transporter substrate-binding protein, partial [Candidatus Sericytochromatia bacterium]